MLKDLKNNINTMRTETEGTRNNQVGLSEPETQAVKETFI